MPTKKPKAKPKVVKAVAEVIEQAKTTKAKRGRGRPQSGKDFNAIETAEIIAKRRLKIPIRQIALENGTSPTSVIAVTKRYEAQPDKEKRAIAEMVDEFERQHLLAILDLSKDVTKVLKDKLANAEEHPLSQVATAAKVIWDRERLMSDKPGTIVRIDTPDKVAIEFLKRLAETRPLQEAREIFVNSHTFGEKYGIPEPKRIEIADKFFAGDGD